MIFGKKDKRKRALLSVTIFAIIILLSTTVLNAQVIKAPELLAARNLLRHLGYWVAADDGTFDITAKYALGAFQSVNRRKATGILTETDLKSLQSAKRLRFKPSDVFRVEIDTSKRILYFVEPDGEISHILPVAIGSDRSFTVNGKTRKAHTPRGTFFIKRQITGWRKSDFGELYYPNYFQGGLAIHGSKKMTLSSYTFGCIAVPMYAAESLSRVLTPKTKIIIR